jgi:hypothetical protein
MREEEPDQPEYNLEGMLSKVYGIVERPAGKAKHEQWKGS